MGVETTCAIEITEPAKQPLRANGKVLLESHGIVLRGDAAVRRTIALSAIREARVDGNWLRFAVADGAPEAKKAAKVTTTAVALELGAIAAAKWHAKLLAPPRTLAQKLGLDESSRAYLHGRTDDAALLDALSAHQTKQIASATIIIAIVTNLDDLKKATATYASSPAKFVWIVTGKGKHATLPESEIRSTLYAQGLRDSKTCAVSETLTATRYGRLA
jgi:hypothetical protein